MNRLTYKNPNGTWGMNNGFNMSKVPSELYGALYKLKDYEESGLSPEQLEEIDRLYLEKCEEVNKLRAELEEKEWIPVEERLPENNKYILLSFSNFSLPAIGRYEEDREGGAFYIGDEDTGCASEELFVNAWRELPEPYKEGKII